MRSRLRSTTYYVAERLAQSILSRFGLELTQAGTHKPLEIRLRKTRRRLKETRRRLKETKRWHREARRSLKEAKGRLKEAKGRLKEERKHARSKPPESGCKPRWKSGWEPATLRQLGFSPRTVVDVGAGDGDGTPELYAAFPDAFHVLVEPLKENEPHLQRILQEYNGQYFLTALGAREEELTINVELPPRWRNMSSIHPRTDFTSSSNPVEKRKIPVTTLDALLDKHDFQAPFGLKVDTEGFEYQVIEGATNFLRGTQFVITEVNVAKVYEGSYSFAEFVEIMAENSFALCDILYTKRMGPGKVLFVDAVFKRADLDGESAATGLGL